MNENEIKPTPKQMEMLASSATFQLWYGSRAGGKSYATYFAPLYYVEEKDFVGLVLRTSFSDLNDYLNTAKRFYEPLGAKVTFGGNPKITFPSGATMFVSYLKDAGSLDKHKGKNLNMIIFEELSQLSSPILFEKLVASLRSTNPRVKSTFIGTTNPDGPLAKYIYDKWRIGEEEGKSEKLWLDEDGNSFQCFKSGVVDNPYIMENDPDYVKYLKGLKGTLYKQWYLGEFVFTADKSQYYHQWILEAEKEDRIKDFYIDPTLLVHTAHDIGINDSWSIVFYQQHQEEIRVINYYENNNEGVQHYIDYLFDFRNKYHINYGVHYGPHDLAVRELSSGKSRQFTFNKMGLHMQLTPNVSIQEGISVARNILPRCHFHKTNCYALVEYLKIYHKEFDEKTQNYRNNPFHGPESHGADAFRYMALNMREQRVQHSQQINANTNWNPLG